MADSFIQLPPDSTGKLARSFSGTVGVNTVHEEAFVLCDASMNVVDVLAANPSGTEHGLVTRSFVQGAPQTTTLGTITSATSAVGATVDMSTANNITVALWGTHAGVNVTFEASPDSGTTWTPIAGVRDDSGIAETSSGVLPSNQTRAWGFGFLGYNRFRVRATAWTSGTANVNIDPGALPFEPFISNVNSVPNRTALVLATASAGVTPAATDTLVTMAQAQRGFAALGSATSFALTAGRIFRVQAMTILVKASTTTAVSASAFLRYNPTGAATATSPIVAAIHGGSTAAVAATGQGGSVSFPDGKDLPAGTTPGQVGVSCIASTATGTVTITVEGYEYG